MCSGHLNFAYHGLHLPGAIQGLPARDIGLGLAGGAHKFFEAPQVGILPNYELTPPLPWPLEDPFRILFRGGPTVPRCSYCPHHLRMASKS